MSAMYMKTEFSTKVNRDQKIAELTSSCFKDVKVYATLVIICSRNLVNTARGRVRNLVTVWSAVPGSSKTPAGQL